MAVASGAYKKALEGDQTPKKVLVKIDRVTKKFDETIAVDDVSLGPPRACPLCSAPCPRAGAGPDPEQRQSREAVLLLAISPLKGCSLLRNGRRF